MAFKIPTHTYTHLTETKTLTLPLIVLYQQNSMPVVLEITNCAILQ
jgi:hypothetical protein